MPGIHSPLRVHLLHKDVAMSTSIAPWSRGSIGISVSQTEWRTLAGVTVAQVSDGALIYTKRGGVNKDRNRLLPPHLQNDRNNQYLIKRDGRKQASQQQNQPRQEEKRDGYRPCLPVRPIASAHAASLRTWGWSSYLCRPCLFPWAWSLAARTHDLDHDMCNMRYTWKHHDGTRSKERTRNK